MSPDDVSEPWRARAEELADWATPTLVSRRDVYGGQYVKDSGVIQRTTWPGELTRERLVRHFAASETQDVIGLHATAPDETCRWSAIDIDAHDGQGASPEANLRFARGVRQEAQMAGLDVRLLDTSGGRGGFHLWIAFDRAIPMADARRLVLWLVRAWAAYGLPRRPDLFPGNDHLTGKKCGNWLRLPGRHHKRPSWATVWSPKRQIWRAGDEAIDALLTLRGRPVDVASIVPADFVVARPQRPSGSPGLKPTASTKVEVEVTLSPPADSEPRGEASSPPKRHGRAAGAAREVRSAREALKFFKNDDLHYDLWLEIGMALRNLEDEATAFRLWDAWSSTSVKYDPEVTAAKWRSIRPSDGSGGIGLGTLFRRAMDSGWSGPAFVSSLDGRGFRRSTHRSGRRGTISIPVCLVGAPAPSARDADEAIEGPTMTRGRREGD